MKKHHDVKNIHFSDEYMALSIDGEKKKFKVKEISSALVHASENERNTYEISASGYGIHWPLINEDLAIDGLLGIIHKRETKRKSA